MIDAAAGALARPGQATRWTTYAADVAALATAVNRGDAVQMGHSTGGGEVARYVRRYGGDGRVAKGRPDRAVPPILVKTPNNPGGLPIEVTGSAPLWSPTEPSSIAVTAGLFYGFNRPGAQPQEGVIPTGGARA